MRWFLLAVLATSACSRNLDVPAADARPVIDSFEPEQAFVGDYLYIAGRNFDPDATSNVITFANRTARAFGKDDQGRLIVQVPNGDYYDLSGNFSVTTPAGVSDPSADPFMLRGQGHIQYATPLGTTRLLHRPPGIAFVSGQLLMASQLIRAVISNEGVVAPLGDEPLGLAPNWDLTAVYAGIKGRVTRVAPGGQPLSSAEIPGQEFQLLAANDTYLFGVGKDPLGVPQVYAFDPETLAVLHHRSLDGILVEATDIGALADGRVALSGKAGGEWGVLLLDPASSSTPMFTHAPSEMAGPIDAVDTGVATAFADGTARVLSTGPTPTWGPVLHTGASTPATALIATGARFGVADPREHTVALIDPAAPDAPVWKAPVAGEPAAIDYDGNKLYVAYADSNNVDTFDGITGAPAGRMVFPVAAGNEVKCGQGSVVDASGAANTESRYLAMSRRSHAIISLNADSLSINAPIPLAQGTSPGRAVVRDRDLLPLDNSTIWVMHDSELGTLGNQTGRDVETVRISGLTTPPDCLLFPPTGELVMVAGNEVSLYRDDQRVGAVQVQGEIIHAAVDPKGRIVVISGDPTQPGGSPKAATYDLAALAAGGAPVETFAGTTKFAGFLGALNTYYGPMLFFNWDTTALASGGFGLILQDGLVPTEPMDSLVNLDGPLLTSPDGGIIAWTRKANPDNTLRFVDLQTDDLQHGLFDYATIKLGGAPVALTYDPTGAYLYVPVPELDEIEVFQ